MAPKKTSNAMIPCDEIPETELPKVGRVCINASVLVCYDLKAGGEDYNSTWKAKVTSIQKSTGSKIKYKVWVTWFYRTSDVLEDAKEKKNDSKTMKAKKKNLRDQFLPALYHPRELFLSSHEQSIDPGCISKVIDVLHFDQGCPRPRVLDGCYFYRATYESSTKELTAPEPTCNCDQPYVPHQEMQALCYDCKTWFHEGCLNSVPESEARHRLRRSWTVPGGAPRLVEFAVGTMRRGRPHSVEGNYGRIYQAKSILSAMKKGDEKRHQEWEDKHGLEPVETLSAPEHGWFLCPRCESVI